MWLLETIRGELPDEAKDTAKQENGRKSAAAKKAKRLTEATYKILLKHRAVTVKLVNSAPVKSA